MKGKYFQTGSVLIMVMLFCLLASSVVVLLLEKSILLQKMNQNMLAEFELRASLENQILQNEQQLYQQFMLVDNMNVTYLQFVPDTLTFGEDQGVDYYQIQVDSLGANALSNLQSVVAVRSS